MVSFFAFWLFLGIGRKSSHCVRLEAFFLIFLAAQKSYQEKCNILDFGCQLFPRISYSLSYVADGFGFP